MDIVVNNIHSCCDESGPYSYCTMWCRQLIPYTESCCRQLSNCQKNSHNCDHRKTCLKSLTVQKILWLRWGLILQLSWLTTVWFWQKCTTAVPCYLSTPVPSMHCILRTNSQNKQKHLFLFKWAHLLYCVQSWSLCLAKDNDMLQKVKGMLQNLCSQTKWSAIWNSSWKTSSLHLNFVEVKEAIWLTADFDSWFWNLNIKVEDVQKFE